MEAFTAGCREWVGGINFCLVHVHVILSSPWKHFHFSYLVGWGTSFNGEKAVRKAHSAKRQLLGDEHGYLLLRDLPMIWWHHYCTFFSKYTWLIWCDIYLEYIKYVWMFDMLRNWVSFFQGQYLSKPRAVERNKLWTLFTGACCSACFLTCLIQVYHIAPALASMANIAPAQSTDRERGAARRDKAHTFSLEVLNIHQIASCAMPASSVTQASVDFSMEAVLVSVMVMVMVLSRRKTGKLYQVPRRRLGCSFVLHRI